MDKYLINPNHKISKINKDIYGHFAEHLGRCIYEGIYVGENSKIPNVNGMRIDVVNALKDMGIPVLRWPGGCFADEYHWKDGIGDKANRKKMINTHWGGVVEDNSFGTHEYFELCRQLGCDTYINGNVGSGSVKEMNEWVEYMTFDGVSPMAELRKQNGSEKPWKINYFGVGNESWGCGGNMDPEYYGCLYKRYNTYVRDYNSNNKIKRIACGPNVDDYHWTREVMDKVKHHAQGISLHYYTIPGDTWEHKGSATEFDTKEYYKTLAKAYRIEELINNHISVMNSVNPQQWVNLVVDEWGTWYDVEPGTNPGFLYQQNTMRDALVAGITLNIFNKHSDRVKMANLAQIVNVLQAVLLTEGDKMIKTPTYHVFDIYKEHQDSNLVESSIEIEMIGVEEEWKVPNLTESVSETADGTLHLTITNLSVNQSFDIDTTIIDRSVKTVKGEIVTEEIHAKNTFEEPECVTVKKYDGTQITEKGIRFTIPACSVLHLEVR